ncbi:MAG: alpha/beta hydrolase [Candidatus Sumerlaea sp.]|uniref:Beta-ketoadipate enol-lactone hydrolase n=1 Tax=Sumerlaea chitinivorans TaxID=2250252 RepID=A0A2Z4Y4G7_SUMC1|nr:Beta-ketoadipate enol-lactone hydrolase [Candidatus Sumerlaea chitinivorans]GIX45670.1 MAG: alpha/beta hydrolase [Candidatus Sumerlaea sp.]
MQLNPMREKIPVVLVHAFPLDSRMWREQVRALSDIADIHTPNVRGFGGNRLHEKERVEDWTVGLFAFDLLQYLDKAGIDRAVLGGCSMGGYIAFEFWRRYPARVAGMILCDTRAEADTPEARENRRQMIERVRREGTGFLAQFASEKLVGKTTREKNPGLVQAVAQWATEAPAETVIGALHALASRPDSTDTLHTISVPVLLLFGEEDIVTPPECGERMLNGLPNARMHLVPAAGHLSPLEAPDYVNAHVADFLRTTIV